MAQSFTLQTLLKRLATTCAMAWVGLTQPVLAQTTASPIDVTFGAAGTFKFTFAQLQAVVASATQSDGKIIVTGNCGPVSPSGDICVSRLQKDGSGIDISFATNGFFTFRSGDSSAPQSVTVDASDRILVGGYCGSPGFVGVHGCLIRLTSTGKIDTSFGANGVVSPFAVFKVTAISVLSDSRIVIAGLYSPGSGFDFYVQKLLESGATDPSFNNGAFLSIFGRNTGYYGEPNTTGPFIAIDRSGNVVITGSCGFGVSPNLGRFCAARVTAAGALDLSFNGTGTKSWQPRGEAEDFSSGIAISATGRILVAGTCGKANSNIQYLCVSALNNAGAVDTTFATGGTFQLIQTYYDRRSTLQQLDTGRLLVGGGANQFVKLYPNGQLDTSFANQGVYDGSASPRPDVRSTFLTADKKVLGSGTCFTGAEHVGCIVRYDLSPPPGERCSLDLDDDGKILPQTDGVMWLRVMLGFRGDAVMQGAMGSASDAPTRTTWPHIRAYLFNHCGIR